MYGGQVTLNKSLIAGKQTYLVFEILLFQVLHICDHLVDNRIKHGLRKKQYETLLSPVGKSWQLQRQNNKKIQ